MNNLTLGSLFDGSGGFPLGGLISGITIEYIRYWYDVFETHRKIVGSSTKPKSLKQIAKWLRDPHSDAAEYKMWGNGVALPCVVFVLSGIVWYKQNKVENAPT